MATTLRRTVPTLPPAPRSTEVESIRVRGCRVHNLKNVDVDIPLNHLTVITGVSGSGKSSLAFDTLYAEGQRRYVESMSAYARQFLERMEKPDADEIDGIAPSIAIRQKNTTRNPRSTVGTSTEIYDYLRLLYARVGQTYCTQCGAEVKKDTVDEVAARLLRLAHDASPESGLRAYILFPLVRADAGGAPPAAASEKSPAAVQAAKKTAASRKKAAAASIDTVITATPLSLSDQVKVRLFDLRKLGYTRLYQDGNLFEFSTPESLLDVDFRRPVWMLADRMVIEAQSRQRLVDSLELCYREGGEAIVEFSDAAGHSTLASPAALPARLTFNELFECKPCKLSYEVPEPRLFSFNSPYGACPRCQGFGNTIDFDEELVIPDKTRALEDGAIEPWTKPRYKVFFNEFRKEARERGVRLDVSYYKLTAEEKEFVWDGRIEGKRGRRALVGINGFFTYLETKKYKLHVRVFLSRFRGYALCPECQGGRLRREAFAVKVGGEDIRGVCRMSIERLRRFFDELLLGGAQEAIAGKILTEIRQRVEYLENVGLEYLTLDRLTSTLSGGEAQRIQLAASLGSHLVGTLYVLDEPSVGLHSRDTARLIRILEALRDQGNTIVVVEHDPAMMEAADRILDLGPAAGENGGRVQFAGRYAELLTSNSTLTGRYLRGDLRISLPSKRRRPSPKKQIKIHGAFSHNLKEVNVSIPLGLLVAVTGVSGSGKSSLIYDVLFDALRDRVADDSGKAEKKEGGGPLFDAPAGDDIAEEATGRKLACRRVDGAEHIQKVVMVDQSPIGRTPRSNPVTYVKAFDPIRSLFADQPESRKRGYLPGHFSFNIPGGRCETCQGSGIVTVEMQFLADVELVCEDCSGTRFKPGVLEINYRGRNIHEILRLTVKEALSFFSMAITVANRLRILDEVGLGYLRLGQSATTLSGGEAQRIKLASHLAAKESEGTLFLFDEPTTGLHFDDIAKLLAAFRKLMDQGGSIVVIEHNLDVIKTADWVIDLGPEGGDRGGEVVCAGTPEQVAECAASHTGRFLRQILDRHQQWGETASDN